MKQPKRHLHIVAERKDEKVEGGKRKEEPGVRVQWAASAKKIGKSVAQGKTEPETSVHYVIVVVR
jgi:hypothetical protein